MKTLDINARSWFDKVNGNSYFSGRVTVDYGTPEEKTFYMPFQYGYGSQYEQEAFAELKRQGYDIAGTYESGKKGVIVRHSIEKNCLKRDVKAYGEGR